MEIEKIIKIMNKVEKNLDLNNSHYEITKRGNIKKVSKRYKTTYYTINSFITKYEIAKMYNFYGVKI